MDGDGGEIAGMGMAGGTTLLNGGWALNMVGDGWCQQRASSARRVGDMTRG